MNHLKNFASHPARPSRPSRRPIRPIHTHPSDSLKCRVWQLRRAFKTWWDLILDASNQPGSDGSRKHRRQLYITITYFVEEL